MARVDTVWELYALNTVWLTWHEIRKRERCEWSLEMGTRLGMWAVTRDRTRLGVQAVTRDGTRLGMRAVTRDGDAY